MQKQTQNLENAFDEVIACNVWFKQPRTQILIVGILLKF